MAKKPEAKLRKAPLTEAVFELRWGLQAGPANEPILRSDPGLLPLLEKFTSQMKKAGYGSNKEMSHPLQTGAYGVVRRYYQRAERPFPLMQIGPGIFAANDGPGYSWKSYKLQILKGVKELLSSYPKLDFFPLSPNLLELRYIDAFDKTILGNATLFHFTEHGTSLNFKLPDMLNDPKIFTGDPAGRFIFQRTLKGRSDSFFHIDLSSAKHAQTKEDVVQMTTKVVSTKDGVPKFKNPTTFLNEIDKWLEFAHDISSPFFKNLILKSVMDKFKNA